MEGGVEADGNAQNHPREVYDREPGLGDRSVAE